MHLCNTLTEKFSVYGEYEEEEKKWLLWDKARQMSSERALTQAHFIKISFSEVKVTLQGYPDIKLVKQWLHVDAAYLILLSEVK